MLILCLKLRLVCWPSLTHAVKKSFKPFCLSSNPFLKPSVPKTALSSNKQKQSLPPGVIRKQALRLDVWLFAFNHFQFYDVDLVFLFALWTEQREVQKNRILIDHRPRLCSALRASDPKCRVIIRHGTISHGVMPSPASADFPVLASTYCTPLL